MNMSSPCERSALLILLFALIMYRSFARDNITPDQSLGYGEKLVSAGGTFALGFFSPKNTAKKYVGIWHNKVTVQTIVWVANRQHPITSNSARLTITLGGSLVITDHNSTIIWSAVSTTVGNPIAQLLDTGNFVVWDAESSSTVNSLGWQSFDYPTDTLLPGMKLGWDLKTGTPHNLTSWKSESDPSPGPFCLAVDKSFEVTEYNGSKIVWRSGMWNGITFNGIPDLRTYGDYVLTFVNNTDEFYLSFQIGDPSTFARIHMSYNGTMDRYVWVNSYNSWDLIQSVPRNPCDPYRVCGTNAYCDSSTLPLCYCIDGFVPKSPANWTLGDATEGCIRKTALACAKGSDGFMKISNMAVPDVATAKIDSSMSLDECRANCLRNCSCWGYANSDIRGAGSGCVMWAELTDMQRFQDAGQDFYIRLAASDLGKRLSADFLNRRRQKAIAITVSLVLGSLLLSCIIYFMWRKKKAIRKESWNEDKDLELPFLPLYDLETLIAATHNFSMENRLGEGGFGTVYKGMLPEGQEIAVKRLSQNSRQGVDEFKNEVSLIAKLQHRNLVRLLGCCTHGEERMLIYEYMPNKSLDAFLFDKAESTNLGWGMRFSIITGIARGLLYLHQDSRFRIIHRDLKASNVLLDGEMNPKISDFGLARIFGTDEATARTRRVVGTYGYMSPEYAMDGIFSVKSDVFSFGVLVLEIVSGQRTKAVYFSEPEDNLLRKAWRLWSEDKGLELIDPAIGSDYSMDEVIRCIKIGLLCVQENPRARPNMSSVVHMLSDREGTMIFEPQQPGFMARNDHSFPSSSSTNQDLPSINAVTVSLVAGR